MKKNHTDKLVYYMMGIGSGIILSGIIMLALLLNVKEIYQYGLNQATQLPSHNTEMDGGNKLPEEATDKEKTDDWTENDQIHNQITDHPVNAENTMPVDQESAVLTSEYNSENNIEKEQSIQFPKEEEASQEVIKIIIPKNYGSSQICKLLQEHGIVEDAEKLQEYIKQQGKMTKLRSGEFYFTKGLEYEEILNILMRKK